MARRLSEWGKASRRQRLRPDWLDAVGMDCDPGRLGDVWQKHWRNRRPEAVFTSADIRQLRENCLRLGADGFVVKSAEFSEIINIVIDLVCS